MLFHLKLSAHWQLGAALAALFGWLLALPMYGPALFQLTGEQAPKLGLLFTFAHSVGLLLLAWLCPNVATWRYVSPAAGGLLAALTLLSLGGEGWPMLVGLMGLVSAVPVQVWCRRFVGAGAPPLALVIAMAGANLILSLVTLAAGLPVTATLLLLALMVTAGSVVAGEPVERPEAPAPPAPLPVPMLSAFAAATFFIGGLWYQIVAAGWSPAQVWPPVLEPLVYAGAILLFAMLLRRESPMALAVYSLSSLGLGLLVGAAGAGGVATLMLHRSLLLVGLAATDLFFWYQLALWGHARGSHTPMGVGLGLSVFLIGGANLVGMALPRDTAPPHPLFLLSGAALLFLMLPVLMRAPKPLAEAPPAEPSPVRAPEGLTQTEQHVYDLLVRGASDAQIAEALVVTRHTVKFHVRNILHKVGVGNRKELLSRLVQQKQEPPLP